MVLSMNFSKETWIESRQGAAGVTNLLFSRANTFDLSAGPARRLSVSVAGMSAGTILAVESSGHAIEVSDGSSLTVMLPTEGTVEVEVEKARYRAERGGILCFAPSHRKTRVFRSERADFASLMLKVPFDRDSRANP